MLKPKALSSVISSEIDYSHKNLQHVKFLGVISGDSRSERKQVVTEDALSVLLIQIHAGTGLNLQHYKQIYISSPQESFIGRTSPGRL